MHLGMIGFIINYGNIMTGFDIFLLCLIGWVISTIFTYKEMSKPSDWCEWILLLIMSLLIFILVVLCLFLVGMIFMLIYKCISDINWYNFFHESVF